MNPTRVSARSFRSYKRLDLELPTGCVAIIGENGSGKSTLISIIELCLFGAKSLAPYLTAGSESTELEITLELEHQGADYKIRRGYSARGRGKTTLDFERFFDSDPEDHWEALTLGSQAETQALIEATFGLTRKTFTASAWLRQGDAGAFCEADPKDRKRILADTLGLDRFELLLAAVRRDRRAAEQEITRIDGRLEGTTREALELEVAGYRATVVAATETVVLATTALTSWEGELEKAALAVQAARENETARAAMKARVDAAAAALAAKGQLQRDAITAGEQAAAVRLALAGLSDVAVTEKAEQLERTLVGQIEQHRAAVAERNQAVSVYELRATEKKTIEAQATATHERMRELDAKVAHIELGELDKCPTCEQLLGAEARKATVGSLRAQAQTLADESAALFERAGAIELPVVPDEPVLAADVALKLDVVRTQLTAAREAELERAKLTERLAAFEQTVARAAAKTYLDDLRAAGDALQTLLEESARLPDPVDVAPLEAAAVTARARVQVERDRLQTAERDRAVAQERLDQLSLRAEQIEKDLAARDKHQAEIDLLVVLERAYGPDGIPALIVENAAIPAIEVEANRILVELGGTTGGCRVELRTDRAKADGGVRDDVLDVIVVTEAGERAYETFSGGERTRLNLALRIALARLLATRRGAESRVLAIDEPEALDDDGTAALADVLLGLERAGVFERIYLVSHVSSLRDAFDQVLHVVKEDGRSRVVGVAESVGVAA